VQEIEIKAIETYQKNLEYFSQSKKELYNQLLEFNQKLEDGSIIASYDLEYLDGYFDIKELRSGYFLYSQDSNEVSQELSKRVNYKKNSFTFEGFPIFNYSKEKQENLIDEERGAEGLFPIMNYYIENSSRDDEMQYIAKYIFIGVGLGGHIISTDKKIDADSYLIIEDNIELFRLSLFVTEYYRLAKKKLYFAIDRDKNQFSDIFADFLGISLHENRYLKYTHFPTHSKEKIKNIQNELAIQTFVTFPYKTILTKYIRPLEYLNRFNSINLSKNFQKSSLSSKPFLILGAGPSLQKDIEFVKKNHSKFVIVAISAMLKTLYKENIQPDIVFHIDGFESSLVHFDGFDTKEFLKNSIAILSPIAPLKLRDIFTQENIFYYQLDTDYIEGFDTISTPCVGSSALIFSLIFGVEDIYILGLDFAFDEKTGSTHSSEHKYNEKIDLKDREDITKAMGIRKNIFRVKGNFIDKIYTNSLFYSSVASLYRFIPLFKKSNQTIYNLSNGLFLEGTVALKSDDVKLKNEYIEKNILHKEIQELFEQYATKELTQKQFYSIEKRLYNSKKLKKLILKYQTKTENINIEKYVEIFYQFIADILVMNSKESKNITTVCDYFLRYTLPLLTDILNSKTIKSKKKHIKVLNDLIIKELFDVEKIYSEALERFIKRETKE